MTVLAATANAMLDAGLAGTVYVGLLVGSAEVSVGSYARQPVTWGAASGGTKANSVDITFPVATASWGSVTGFALYTAVSGGSVVDSFPGAIDATLVGIGAQFLLAAGDLVMGVA